MEQIQPNYDKLIRRDETGVWMLSDEQFTSVARDLACRVMSSLGMDPINDFRTRDDIITAIAGRLHLMLDSYVLDLTKERDKLADKLAYLKKCGLTVGMMKEAGKEPRLIYDIERGSELCELKTLDKLVNAQIECGKLAKYASYCRSCALSGEHNPQTYEEFNGSDS